MSEEDKQIPIKFQTLESEAIRGEHASFGKIILRQLDRVNAAFSRGNVPGTTAFLAGQIAIDGSLIILEADLYQSLKKHPDIQEEIRELKKQIAVYPVHSYGEDLVRRHELLSKLFGLMVSTLGDLGMLETPESEGVESGESPE